MARGAILPAIVPPEELLDELELLEELELLDDDELLDEELLEEELLDELLDEELLDEELLEELEVVDEPVPQAAPVTCGVSTAPPLVLP